jgi:phage terminase large subunit-like protein
MEEAACRFLPYFIRYIWPELEPRRPLIWGRHIDIVCAGVEALMRGDLPELSVNIPPRCSKSTICSVAGPAWWWLTRPECQFICATKSDIFASRDARLMRQVVRSERYRRLQARVGLSGFAMQPDQDQVGYYANNYGGHRISVPMGSSVIGGGADVLILDDPVDPKEAMRSSVEQSVRIMDRTWSDIENALVPRLNPGGRMLNIMQRLHFGDPAGRMIRQGSPAIVLPMEFDPDHPARCPDDWRTEPGQLLTPERFGPAQVAREKARGAHRWNCMYYQWPQQLEGGSFRRALWGRYQGDPRDQVAGARAVWLTVDCANEESRTAANSVIMALALVQTPLGLRVRLLDVLTGKWELPELREAFRLMCGKWPTASQKLIEYAANGIALVQTESRTTVGIVPVNPRGDRDYPGGSKEERAQYTLLGLHSGMLELPEPRFGIARDGTPWADVIVEEHAAFPLGLLKDHVDALSQAMIRVMVDAQKRDPEADIKRRWSFLDALGSDD